MSSPSPEAVSHAQQNTPSHLSDQWLAGGPPVLLVLVFTPYCTQVLFLLFYVCLFDVRLESLVFAAASFDRWKSCTRCTCSMLGYKLLLALWGSDQSLGNSKVQESRSQVNVDGFSWGLIPSLNGAACASFFPLQ